MRALVAMSGGVDSSVAAAVMVEQGHEVVGVTLKQWEGPDGRLPTAGCCTVADAEDARRVAARLGVPYYVLDYTDQFAREVVARFGEGYLAGRTPNPCIECNRRVRFGALLDRVEALGCDVLVTGHHARVDHVDGRFRLLAGRDSAKDQSYVLHMLGQAELARIVLPIGEMTKEQVRAEAKRLGLRTATKPDSQDLCFVQGDYRDFLREHFPDSARPGSIVDSDGVVVGSHDGVSGFTVGQRRGLGVSVGEPRYVLRVDAATATVTLGPRSALEVEGCALDEVSFVAGAAVSDGLEVGVKVRYRSRPVPAVLRRSAAGWQIRFDRPAEGVAPGQAAVFYLDDEVLGGGTIVAAA
ncbi:MAG: tRNA 2-thiouridine(34) synthase MnmA [Acidimicrobiia bacterium]